ncbi:unnamed protein product (macronuclear) [Paramecium tetraurelia]|uniref:FHA domain protein n=1 Tax=Paramecium tetraurelia TaxID=5888 RepID=A0DNA4_PARTE|nr:uncharacterized protein GSPATT00018726001 [Paramecium tetraurelia]CAK84521.1 unnamed protein product [Paramecium tetraurelia]|eukprot:XP_001451918.1 hypothetical protein (macronuclear) [Paramecium tetraurelia strain d4-2]
MDYESLYKLIPKEPKKWLTQDVINWLKFIGLGQMEQKFVECSIDGAVLEDLTEKDLDEELGITQRIIKRKLLNWVNHGLKEYNEYIKQMKMPNLNNKKQQDEDFTIQKNVGNVQFEQMLMESHENNGNEQFTSSLQNKKYQDLTNSNINQYFSQQKVNSPIFIVFAKQVPKLEDILATKFQFWKRTSADFMLRQYSKTPCLHLKIQEVQQELLLKYLKSFDHQSKGDVNQNWEKLEQLENGGIEISLFVIEGPNLEDTIIFQLNKDKPSVALGRKSTVDISFPEDHHLSNQHAKFYLVEQTVTLEDHGSTNGSWMRLSGEGKMSNLFYLDPNEEIIIRIGTTNQYICQQNKMKVNEISGENLCIICVERERDCLILPCKHNATCLKCSKSLALCPFCRVKIQETIRIYKN